MCHQHEGEPDFDQVQTQDPPEQMLFLQDYTDKRGQHRKVSDLPSLSTQQNALARLVVHWIGQYAPVLAVVLQRKDNHFPLLEEFDGHNQSA